MNDFVRDVNKIMVWKI